MIKVDDRVGSKELAPTLRKLGAPVLIQRLKYADFRFWGNGPNGSRVRIGIERKTVGEMVQAVTDSRFVAHQLPGLLKRYDIVVLVIEGRSRPDPKSGVLMSGREFPSKKPGLTLTAWHDGFGYARHLYENVTKFRLTLAFKGKLIVERTADATETAYFIRTLYGWFDKRWAAHKAAYRVDETRPDQAILDERTIKRQVFAQLPHVGWERSKQVAQYFKTIGDGMAASEDEWMRALRIQKGRKIARTIVTTIRGAGKDKGKGR